MQQYEHAAIMCKNGQPQKVFVGFLPDCDAKCQEWQASAINEGYKLSGGKLWKGGHCIELEVFEAETAPPPTKEAIQAALQELRNNGIIPTSQKTEWQLIAECTAMLNQIGEAYRMRCSVFQELENNPHSWICEATKFDYDGRESVLLSIPDETPFKAIREMHMHITEWVTIGKIPE